ncbi:hypothetical protein G6F40_015075 [Rhizopus arrhizus]|nr:hypothetical protein G6F40_015075 [Rhizopus arrhizus]
MAGASVDLEGSTVVGAKDPDDMQAIRRFAVAYLRNEQNLDLAAFGVDFDIYFLESSLYADGKVAEAVDKLYGEIAPTGPHELGLVTREAAGVESGRASGRGRV